MNTFNPIQYVALGVLLFLVQECLGQGTSINGQGFADKSPFTTRHVGVSLAGGEFGVETNSFSNLNPGQIGKEYTLNSKRTLEYFGRKGVRLIRLPFRWERIQPTLGGELDTIHLRSLKDVCDSARSAGVKILLDVHNYGRYRADMSGRPRTFIIDQWADGRQVVSRYHFADLWRRLAIEFRNDAAVVGYGLMNEPHNMGASSWPEISQVAVNAIRRVDPRTAVVVSGDDWASAARFPVSNGAPWIRDPANHVVYEAHCYFDHDGSGKYSRTYDQEFRMDKGIVNRGVQRVKPFLEWCRRHKVSGFIGEYGTPSDAEWKEVTGRFLRACAEANVSVCYWGAGEWWGNYPLSVQPDPEFRHERAQLVWMRELYPSRPVSHR